jgi:hypothetical protein
MFDRAGGRPTPARSLGRARSKIGRPISVIGESAAGVDPASWRVPVEFASPAFGPGAAHAAKAKLNASRALMVLG